jgi:hypothetical protein
MRRVNARFESGPVDIGEDVQQSTWFGYPWLSTGHGIDETAAPAEVAPTSSALRCHACLH